MAAGLGRKRLRGHDLTAPFYGVRSSQTPTSARALCEAYLPRMHADQYFSHVSAALLYGIPLPRICEQRASIDVSVSAPAHPPRARGVIGHRLASDTPVRLLRDYRLAAPVETWLQLGTVLQLDDMIIAVISSCGENGPSPRSTSCGLRHAWAEGRASRWPGVRLKMCGKAPTRPWRPLPG
jgi:hypothetical protein